METPCFGMIWLEVDFDERKIRESAVMFDALAILTGTTQLSFAVSGYDDDPRELWEVPEVLQYLEKWLGAVRQNGGHGLYRLDQISTALLLLASGKAEVEKTSSGGARFWCKNTDTKL